MSQDRAAPTIIIADDHPMVRAAMTTALRSRLDGVVLFEAADRDALEAAVEENADADLVLLDLNIPGARGFSVLLHLRSEYPGLRVAVVSANELSRTVARARQFGAVGFIPKSAPVEQMLESIRLILDGETWFPEAVSDDPETAEMARRLGELTPQQLRVLMCIADGLLNKQIAYELSLAENTVKVHVTAILRKLGVNSRTQAALIARSLESDSEDEI